MSSFYGDSQTWNCSLPPLMLFCSKLSLLKETEKLYSKTKYFRIKPWKHSRHYIWFLTMTDSLSTRLEGILRINWPNLSWKKLSQDKMALHSVQLNLKSVQCWERCWVLGKIQYLSHTEHVYTIMMWYMKFRLKRSHNTVLLQTFFASATPQLLNPVSQLHMSLDRLFPVPDQAALTTNL